MNKRKKTEHWEIKMVFLPGEGEEGKRIQRCRFFNCRKRKKRKKHKESSMECRVPCERGKGEMGWEFCSLVRSKCTCNVV